MFLICFRHTSVFSDENGVQVYTQYECSSVTVGVPDVMLSLEQTSATTYDIHMDNSGLVAGIQFTLSDDPDAAVAVDYSSEFAADIRISFFGVRDSIWLLKYS